MTNEAELISLADAMKKFRRAYWGGPTPDELLPIPDLGSLWPHPDREALYAAFENSICFEERKLAIALANGYLTSSTSAGATPRKFWLDTIRPERPMRLLGDSTIDEKLMADQFDRWVTTYLQDPFFSQNSYAKRGLIGVLKDLLEFDLISSHQFRELCGRWKIKLDASAQHVLRKADRGYEGEYWSVDQALSWILWRDFERLDLDPLGIFVHAITDDHEGNLPPRYSLRDANAVLVALLQRGVVHGFAGAPGATQEIQPYQFADATIVHTASGHVVAFPAFPGDNMGLAGHFDRLRILGTDLTKEMPPINLGVAEFMSRNEGPIDSPNPHLATSQFEPNAGTMLIGEVALWLAAQGECFKNPVARADRLDKIGAPRLFAALARGDVVGMGLNVSTRRREAIPADIWAECDQGENGDEAGKHRFSFLDDVKKNEFGGSISLWPHRSKESADWCDIRLSNSALLSAFGDADTSAAPQAPSRESTTSRPGRGRPEGTGKDDGPALTQVRSLMSQGVGKMRAVRQVAASLQNEGVVESTEKRLLRKLQVNSSR